MQIAGLNVRQSGIYGAGWKNRQVFDGWGSAVGFCWWLGIVIGFG